MSKHLRYAEVVTNVFLFMLAGFETTSTFLAYGTYVLATHPEIQKKLQDEVDSVLEGTDPVMDYETVADLEYMDLFVKEVLRMYRTSGKASTRLCNKTTSICGHQIEEGMRYWFNLFATDFCICRISHSNGCTWRSLQSWTVGRGRSELVRSWPSYDETPPGRLHAVRCWTSQLCRNEIRFDRIEDGFGSRVTFVWYSTRWEIGRGYGPTGVSHHYSVSDQYSVSKTIALTFRKMISLSVCIKIN